MERPSAEVFTARYSGGIQKILLRTFFFVLLFFLQVSIKRLPTSTLI